MHTPAIPSKLALLIDANLLESARSYAARHTPARPQAALRGLVYAALNAWIMKQPRTNLGGIRLKPGRVQWVVLEPPAELMQAWITSIYGSRPSAFTADTLSASLHHALSEHLQQLQRSHAPTSAAPPVMDDPFGFEGSPQSLEDALASIISTDENEPAPPPSPSTRPGHRGRRDMDIPAIFARSANDHRSR